MGNGAAEAGIQADQQSAIVWPRWKRTLFRFGFCFWTLFCLTQGLTNFFFWFWPWLNDHVDHLVTWPTQQLTLWAGRHVFHLSGIAATVHPTGSGDTALRWIEALVLLSVSLMACVVWSAISEARARRFEYQTLFAWLHLGTRFVLAYILLLYGFDKIFPLQFPDATGERLTTTYAESSPMGLLWRFVGSSALYRIFGGLAEVLPALLLLSRRTATLGALGALTVMTNVVALNLGYDVSVKLYSIELLAMALFLVLPDASPMWQFFIQGQSSHLSKGRVPRSERRPLRVAASCLQALTVGYVLYQSGLASWQEWRGDHTPLSGAWHVQSASGSFAGEGWTSLSTNRKDGLHVSVAGKVEYLKMEIDQAQQTVRIFGDFNDPDATAHSPSGVLRWTSQTADQVQLSGTWHGQPAALLLRRYLPDSKLETRGFHWVQEEDVNR